MENGGQQFFARARLAKDEHISFAVCRLRQEVKTCVHLRRAADNAFTLEQDGRRL